MKKLARFVALVVGRMKKVFVITVALVTGTSLVGAQSPRYRATLIAASASKQYMNNLDQVVYTDTSTNQQYAYLWTNTERRPISLSGPINDFGYILNYNQIRNVHNSAYLENLSVPQSWVYSYFGADLNNNNVAALLQETYRIGDPTNFLCRNTSSYEMVGIQGSGAYSFRLNNLNEAVWQNRLYRADGSYVSIANPASTEAQLVDINDTSDALGYRYVNGIGVTEGAIWDRDLNQMHTLARLPSRNQVYFNTFNSQKFAVGTGYDRTDTYNVNARALLWTPMTGTLDLNGLVDNLPSGESLTWASSINERGSILAGRYTYTPATNKWKTNLYILNPVPEPSSMIFLTAGLGLMLRKRKLNRPGVEN